MSSGVAECPMAGGSVPTHRCAGRTRRQIARDVVAGMLGFRCKFTVGDTDPKRGVGISAGQGGASGGYGPCPLSRLRTNRGYGVSTASRALC